MSEGTQIPTAVPQGDSKASDQLLPIVYDELRRVAAQAMARERPGHTLQPTALVHEAYLRLAGSGRGAEWSGRTHFFGAAAEAMRRILIESARRKKAVKHGGKHERIDFEAVDLPLPMPADELLALNDALDQLAGVDSRAADVVKLCFFVGLTQTEAAKELGISVATVERLWSFARAWLSRALTREGT